MRLYSGAARYPGTRFSGNQLFFRLLSYSFVLSFLDSKTVERDLCNGVMFSLIMEVRCVVFSDVLREGGLGWVWLARLFTVVGSRNESTKLYFFYFLNFLIFGFWIKFLFFFKLFLKAVFRDVYTQKILGSTLILWFMLILYGFILKVAWKVFFLNQIFLDKLQY